ncbi:hypothetical protein [Ruminococcus sp.]|uniref:hypothetical protein n=1 Tax=Ruminococcus sp. TaxID=41978 RepID=UPI0025E78BF8|nr:hypothetical protein [Ruminococcus sp.]
MKRIKKVVAVTAAFLIALSATACEKDSATAQSSAVSQIKNSSNAAPTNTKVASYSFPEFLGGIKTLDELSVPLYQSFDPAQYTKDVDEQPFEDYTCESQLVDMFYTFRSGKFVGLLDKNGDVLIEADEYTEITVVTKGLLQLSYDKERNAPMQYYSYSDDGKIEKTEHEKFSTDKLDVFMSDIDEEGNTYQQLILPDGSAVVDAKGDGNWHNIKDVSMSDIATSKAFKGYYVLKRGSAVYYACFDDFYNYTIYEAAYALVKIKVDGTYGECYIMNYDDYAELEKMIDSFGYSSYRTAPSKDPGLDFIQITFGLKDKSQTDITISSDGYCLTETQSDDTQQVNKYFSYLDKEDFADLILWTDDVLSGEYQSKK